MTTMTPPMTTPIGSTPPAMASSDAARATGRSASRRQGTTAQLLQLLESSDGHLDLVPVGVALHHFTEPARAELDLTAVDMHRATTILTKQVKRVLADEQPLATIRILVTDPRRIAAADGRTVEQLCGDAWPQIRAIASDRAEAALEGASAFGEAAVLRLAATRAAVPGSPWWGTRGWVEMIDRWISDSPVGRRSIAALLDAPENVEDAVLAEVLDR